jgi:UMF1 family MFS transporter
MISLGLKMVINDKLCIRGKNMKKPSPFTTKEWAYIFYDWAESAFTVVVTTFIFPILYGILANNAGIANNVSAGIFSILVSAISFVIAILSPILGTLSDYKGLKKKFFLGFFSIGVIFTFLISLYPVVEDIWWVVLIPYVLSTIGYAATNVFYDSFIVDVTTDERMDSVSTTAYAFGYIGGSTIPLILSIVLLTILPEVSGFEWLLPHWGFQLTFIITGIWWLVFSIPFIKNVDQVHGIEPEKDALKKAFSRIFNTLKEAKKYKKVFLFLIAFFLYIDGVHTIINLAQQFATNAIDSVTPDNASEILLPIFLMIQVAAFIFAMIFARLAKFIKTEYLLFVTIGIYSFISILGLFIRDIGLFTVLGLLVATSQGAIQSLSRSYFGKIIPKHKANEFFGLYTIFSRFAAVLGPLIVGSVALIVDALVPDLQGGSMRYGILALIFLFIGGAYFFNRARKEPANYLKEEIR